MFTTDTPDAHEFNMARSAARWLNAQDKRFKPEVLEVRYRGLNV